jgi:hypothetical protein
MLKRMSFTSHHLNNLRRPIQTDLNTKYKTKEVQITKSRSSKEQTTVWSYKNNRYRQRHSRAAQMRSQTICKASIIRRSRRNNEKVKR